MKILVIYFSAQGTTAKIAKELAASINADLFEIKPETPYSPADMRNSEGKMYRSQANLRISQTMTPY